MQESFKKGKADAAEQETHAEATFATAGAILISQWTHNLIVGIRDGEGRCQGGSRRHRQRGPRHAQRSDD
jgi:hypothetical protein